jgi:serine/threonine protein kinase/WD40 repeat protein
MTRWQRIEEVFEQVLDLPGDEQSKAIERLCGGDAWLCERVLALVRADRDITSHSLEHIEHNAARARAELEKDAGPRKLPARIGEFAVKARLGQGGFGTVYLAQQEQPVRRTVAVKVIRAGFDTETILARFVAERRTLASLDHPNIARMISAGQTDEGLPFFSMEFVDGPPIARFCDQRRMSIPERLRLFLGVCRAMAHAHQRGVVHRDLKPGNVLVAAIDGVPVAKVIDFGIAKVLHDTGDWGATLASVGQLMGTPEYMSPEQARTGGQDVGTRSDIYALGVMLQELATGLLPFDRETLKRAGPVQACKIIAEQEPQSPTQRLRDAYGAGDSHAQARSLPDSAALARQLRGDLSIIIAKATAFDPARRYASAEELARDIEHYLERRPIAARPPSLLYRAQRFAARHTAGLAASLALLALAGSIAWGVQRTLQNRRLALQEASLTARRAYDAAIASINGAANALEHGPPSTARAALDAVPHELRGWEWRVIEHRIPEPRNVGDLGLNVLHLALSPDGTMLAAGSYHEKTAVLDIASGKVILTLSPERERRGSAGVAWSKDGRLALGKRGAVWIGDPRSPAGAREWAVPGIPEALSWNADGTKLAFIVRGGSDANGVGALDVQTGLVLALHPAPTFQHVLHHPTMPVVLWGDLMGFLHAYDYEAHREILNTRLCGDGVVAVRLSPDGASIAAASSCQVIAIFDARTLQLTDKLRVRMAATNFDFAPDGRSLLICTIDSRIDRVSLETGTMLESLHHDAWTQTLAVDPRSGTLYASRDLGAIVAYAPRTSAIDLGLGSGGAYPVAIGDGPFVAVQEEIRGLTQEDSRGRSRVFDTRDGSVLLDITTNDFPSWNPRWTGVPGNPDAAWHLDNRRLTLYDLRTGKAECSTNAPRAHRLFCARGGDALLLARQGLGWQLRDARTGEPRRDVFVPEHLYVLDFSPDGARVLCQETSWDVAGTPSGNATPHGHFSIRDALTGGVVVYLEPRAHASWQTRFSDDGTLCVGVGESVYRWDARTGACLPDIVTEQFDHDAAWLADGNARVLLLNTTGRLQVWDSGRGNLVTTFPASGLGTLTRDGTLATVGSDRALRLLRPSAAAR